jgi:hypothetical protein
VVDTESCWLRNTADLRLAPRQLLSTLDQAAPTSERNYGAHRRDDGMPAQAVHAQSSSNCQSLGNPSWPPSSSISSSRDSCMLPGAGQFDTSRATSRASSVGGTRRYLTARKQVGGHQIDGSARSAESGSYAASALVMTQNSHRPESTAPARPRTTAGPTPSQDASTSAGAGGTFARLSSIASGIRKSVGAALAPDRE